MIIHFFLLAALCMTPKIQASAMVEYDKHVFYDHWPLFSTEYICKQIPTILCNISTLDYKVLRSNSLKCIKDRIEQIDVISHQDVYMIEPHLTTLQIFYSQGTALTSDASTIVTTEQAILMHMQWMREINVEMKKHGDNYDTSVTIGCPYNTILIPSPQLRDILIKHIILHAIAPIKTLASGNTTAYVYRVRDA
jgi:hypothetical protein